MEQASKGESVLLPYSNPGLVSRVYSDRPKSLHIPRASSGLVALQEADEAQLSEPEQGYCMPGLSFTPNE